MHTFLKNACLITFMCIKSVLHAQTPNWVWAQTATGNNNENGTSVCADASGNVYVAGEFACAHITFGSITLNNTQSSGAQDIFVVKYNSAGTVLWAKSAGGSNLDFAADISIDAQGNCYVTGTYTGYCLSFGSDTVFNSNYSINNTGDRAIYVVKYNSSGIVQWAKSFGGNTLDIGIGVSVDVLKNVYLTGDFMSPTIEFDTIHSLNNTMSNGNTYDMFIAKLDSSANVKWVRKADGNLDDHANAIATDMNGNSAVLGIFKSPTLSMGVHSITRSNFSGYQDIFLTWLDSAGNFLWEKRIGDTMSLNEFPTDLDLDDQDNILMCGSFETYTLTFGIDTLNNPNGLKDGFLAKFDTLGQPIWGRLVRGTDYDWVSGISSNQTGEIFISGAFASQWVSFGSDSLQNSNFVNQYSDIYTACYDDSGNYLYSRSAGGGTYDHVADAIGVDANNNCYITGGSSSGIMHFGSINLSVNNPLGTQHVQDYFAAKISFPMQVVTGGPSDQDVMSLHIFPSPSAGTLHLDLDGRAGVMTVTDESGRIVVNKKIDNDLIDLQLAPGIYVITVYQEGKTSSGRVVITN